MGVFTAGLAVEAEAAFVVCPGRGSWQSLLRQFCFNGSCIFVLQCTHSQTGAIVSRLHVLFTLAVFMGRVRGAREGVALALAFGGGLWVEEGQLV